MLIITISGLSIACTALVLNLHMRNPPVPMPQWLDKLILKYMACMVCYKPNIEEEEEEEEIPKQTKPQSPRQKYRRKRLHEGWGQEVNGAPRNGHGSDNASFRLQNSEITFLSEDYGHIPRPAYTRYHENNSRDHGSPRSPHGSPRSPHGSPRLSPDSPRSPHITEHDMPRSNYMTESEYLQALLLEVRKITKKISDNDKEGKLQSKWQEAAKVLDRFFLLLFSFVLGSTMIILFCVVPLYVTNTTS